MYTTLANVKAELKTQTNNDDSKLLTYIRTVTARIRSMHNPQADFEPQWDQKFFTPCAENTGAQNGALLLIDGNGQEYLLAGNGDNPSVIRSGQALTWGTDVLPYPQNYTPIKTIRLSDSNGQVYRTWYAQCAPPYFETVNITGWWGWRQNYASMGWLSSLQTVLNNPLSASGTTINVTSVNAADSLGRTPTFSAGNLIRVEGEAMLVLATDATLNTLTVQRGTNGTAAVTHNAGTAITIWEPQEQIVGVATRQACLLYARRGAFDQMTIEGVATTTYPRDLIREIYDVLQEFNNQ